MRRWHAVSAGLLAIVFSSGGIADPLPAETPAAKQEAQRLNALPPVPPAPAGHIDHSGRKQSGRASYYAKRFAHRKMADGKPMNPDTNIAASKTLPLGTVAKVTNLENGKTATVKIEDRGPYVNGRVVDLAPKVANDLDMQHQGVAPVEVKPITVPEPDGQVKLGAGAADASAREVHEAIRLTKELTAPESEETASK